MIFVDAYYELASKKIDSIATKNNLCNLKEFKTISNTYESLIQ